MEFDKLEHLIKDMISENTASLIENANDRSVLKQFV